MINFYSSAVTESVDPQVNSDHFRTDTAALKLPSWLASMWNEANTFDTTLKHTKIPFLKKLTPCGSICLVRVRKLHNTCISLFQELFCDSLTFRLVDDHLALLDQDKKMKVKREAFFQHIYRSHGETTEENLFLGVNTQCASLSKQIFRVVSLT